MMMIIVILSNGVKYHGSCACVEALPQAAAHMCAAAMVAVAHGHLSNVMERWNNGTME